MGFWDKEAANEPTFWVPEHTLETLGVQREPRGAHKGSNGSPRGTQGSPKGIQGEPKRPPGDPKRCPREPRGAHKGTKGAQKRSRGGQDFVKSSAPQVCRTDPQNCPSVARDHWGTVAGEAEGHWYNSTNAYAEQKHANLSTPHAQSCIALPHRTAKTEHYSAPTCISS